MTKKVLFILLALALAVSLSLISCGGTPSQQEEEEEEEEAVIKIGHIVNLQGPEATVGVQEQISLDAAFSEDGLGTSVAGKTVQVITRDALASVQGAVDAATTLVESDGVCAIFGPTEVGQKFAVAEYCKGKGVPLLLYNPAPSGIVIDNEWVIPVSGVNDQYGTCMGDYLYTHLGYDTITTLTEEGAGGEAFMNPVTDTFAQAGGDVAQQQWVDVGTTNFASNLAILDPSAEAFVAWIAADSAIALITQFYDAGLNDTYDIQGAFHGAFFDPFVINAINAVHPEYAADLVGACCPMEWAPDADTPENNQMLGVLTPLFLADELLGFPPGDDAGSGPWQAATLFLAAVEETGGDITGATLRDALKHVSIVGPHGPECFNDGDVPTINMYILEVAAHGPAYGYSLAYTYEDVPPAGYSP